MTYETVLLDLDHTLLDTAQSERAAFADMLANLGVESSDRLLETYRSINTRLWRAVERGELSPDFVRLQRFTEFVAVHDLDADPVEMSERFAEGLKNHGSLYPGVVDVLDRLSGLVSLGLVTNGLSDIQRARIDRLGLVQYFPAIVISSEVGVAKPDPRIFSIAFDQLEEPAPETAIMVGDSLTSDMAGAAAFGIDGCWYNPDQEVRPVAPDIAFMIQSLDELVGIVGRERA